MDREQIITAIAELRKHGLANGGTLGYHAMWCDEVADTLEELTEENDRLRADAVRKMAEMIEDHCIKGGIYPAFVSRAIEQVAEEILDTENDSQSVSQSVSQSTDTCVSCGNIIPEGRQVCLICEEEVREND
jgi:hypothetical protein